MSWKTWYEIGYYKAFLPQFSEMPNRHIFMTIFGFVGVYYYTADSCLRQLRLKFLNTAGVQIELPQAFSSKANHLFMLKGFLKMPSVVDDMS